MYRGIVSLVIVLTAILPAASTYALPVERAVCNELAQMYELDTANYVIEIETNRLKTTDVRPGQLTIRPLTRKQPLGLFTVAATIEIDGRMVESAQLRLRITRFADVLVATDRIGLHDNLAGDNLAVRRMDITSLHEKPLRSLAEVEGLRAKRNVRRGDILTSAAVEIPPDVEAGRDVTIVYNDGPCRITTKGTVLQPGAEGDYIKVRNKTSGKIIVARVVDDTQVAVEP